MRHQQLCHRHATHVAAPRRTGTPPNATTLFPSQRTRDRQTRRSGHTRRARPESAPASQYRHRWWNGTLVRAERASTCLEAPSTNTAEPFPHRMQTPPPWGLWQCKCQQHNRQNTIRVDEMSPLNSRAVLLRDAQDTYLQHRPRHRAASTLGGHQPDQGAREPGQ